MRERKWRLHGRSNLTGYERETFDGYSVVREFSNDGDEWLREGLYNVWHNDKQDFTGFRDSEGTEIYEGDRVLSYGDVTGTVCWDDKVGGWQVLVDNYKAIRFNEHEWLFDWCRFGCRVVKESK